MSYMATSATAFPHCNHLLYNSCPRLHCRPSSRPLSIRSFGRRDFDRFSQRIVSREIWRDAWLGANDGFELFLFEARKTAERIDLRYSVSHRVRAAALSAADRALSIDREFEISRRWRIFTLDFSRNWPRYRKELNDFLQTPLGRGFSTIVFLWFALSGWLFRCLIFATWILPFAGPLLIRTAANNLAIKGSCPACKRQFVGYKNQVVRCTGCGNIVWQPKGDFFSGGGFPRSERGNTSKKSEPDIIDVEFEEKRG